MADFDWEFDEAADGRNALTRVPLSMVASVTAANINAVNLQQKIDALHRRGGGFLHFRPGRYYIGRRPESSSIGDPAASTENGDIVVYEDVTLWFSPGAVLVPLSTRWNSDLDVRHVYGADSSWEDELVRIEIHGAIRAQRVTIFGVSVRYGATLPDAGMILLAGDRIEEVVPEWWGANEQFFSVGLSTYNRLAIQATFDAAHRHRQRPVRHAATGRVARTPTGEIALRRRPPIPIAMNNAYTIDAEVSLGMTRAEVDGAVDPMRPVNGAGFRLRGDRSVGSQGAGVATLYAAGHWDGGALLAIRGPVGFTVNDVTLNGNKVADRCLELSHFDNDGAPSSIERSSLLQPRSELVRIEGSAADTAKLTPPALLSFRRCRFDTMSEGDAFAARLLYLTPERGLVGVHLDARDRVIVEFHGCFFAGVAAPFILAKSGWFTLQECTMHAIRLWDTRSLREINAERGSLNGTDIHIAAPTFRYATASSDGAPRRTLLEAASFTAKEIESQSWQLLTTYALSPSEAQARTSTILFNFNANLSADAPGNAASDGVPEDPRRPIWRGIVDQPAIFWSSPGEIGSDLAILGGIFSAWIKTYRGGRSTGLYKGYVHIDRPSAPGRVFDLGTRSRDDSTNVFGSRDGVAEVNLQVVPEAPRR